MYSRKRTVDDIHIFLLVHKESQRILDGNRLAKNYFGWEEEPPQLMDIFPKLEIIRNPIQNLDEEESIRLYGVSSVKATGENFLCDIEISYTDKSQHLVFISIKDRAIEEDRGLLEVVDLVDNPVVVFDLDEGFTVHFGSYKFYQSLRQTKKTFQESYNSQYGNFLDDLHRVAFSKSIHSQLARGSECHVDLELSHDGHYYHLFYFNGFQSQVDGRLYGVLISLRNPSDLVKKIQYDQQFLDVIQEFSKDLLFRMDVKERSLVHRGDLGKFDGLLPEMENIPESMAENQLIHPEDVEGYQAFMYRMIHGQGATYEARLRLISGKYEKYRFQGKPLFDNEGKTVQVVGRMENIQKLVDIEQRANYDSLTATLDKESFEDLLENILSRAVQNERHGLLLLKFDDFSGLNAKLGEKFGDFFLEVAGRRIINNTRNLDKVSRLGAAQFAVFFHHTPSHAMVLERANMILHAMRRVFSDGETEISVNTSIGVAVCPDHGESYRELYNKAAMALARSQYLGGDVATLYHEDLE